MSKREYEWVDIQNPPEIGRHSLNKHEVLKAYLERYLNKLYARARERVRCSFIDGFSGGGIYKRPDTGEIHYGSPIILMETVNDCEKKLAGVHGKDVKIDARYYFVEKEKRFSELLQQVLREKGLNPVQAGLGGCFNSEFVAAYPKILNSIQSEGRTHKAIFVLDQYGYADVPFVTIQQLFKDLPNAEVILTFAVDWLIDYLSIKPGHVERCQSRLDSLGIGCSVEELLTIRDQGGRHWRLLIQDLLSEELSRSCGANYYTRYFIQTEKNTGKQSHRSIWLVHMSMHEVARDEMVKVHWDIANEVSMHSGFQGIDEAGVKSLGYTTHKDAKLGQLNFDYSFDRVAEEASIGVLLSQLPDLLWKREQCTFSAMMGEIANYTPVSSRIIREVLNHLLKSRDIKVTSTEGVVRRAGSAIKWDDIIEKKQFSMFDFPASAV